MFHRFVDFDRTFNTFDELRRRIDRIWDDYESARPDLGFYASSAWPKVNVFDAGDSLVFRADVPGVAEKDFNITLTPDGLTLSGERKTVVPEGYSVQRQERPAARFSRSWTLPYKVDAERTQATLKDGVLTINLTKAPEAQPRQITVRAQS
jgi:HSP20 family protein